ncbi:zinc finger MYM-type protein 1-like [Melanotaenia boesemani]|uniref:zinc finger MYM-type protein 1-like n=1 Tax=Melanotaenia boesemani TaxID=1250792 RepID=UPI001C04D83C|nr:zinc finger MYM-type protein 1-like [Melanotaenia boesemani]
MCLNIGNITEDEDGEDNSNREITSEPQPPAPSDNFLTGPKDISQSKAESPAQPRLKAFPRTLQGARLRSFNETWYQSYKWLEYSVIQDSSFCYACRHFSLPNAPQSVFTSMSGFRNWKKALFKDAGFKLHAKSKEHASAMYAWLEHTWVMETDSSMLHAINKDRQKKIEENQKYIKTIADVLLLTATQNIAQRGHRESAESHNRGNFLVILQKIAKHDPQIQKCMNASGNAKYTSKNIQNEILDCLAEMVRSDIIKEVRESQVFSLLADETKDLSKKEQLSFVLRYYYDGAVHESFLDFQQADKLDAASLTTMIIASLEKYGLEYRSHLVGQGYDGASVMSGRHSGVSARIKAEAKYAFYVHCSAHCLNLVLVDTVKSVPEADNFFAVLQRLYVFISGSYLHQKGIEVQKEMYEGQPRELHRLSDTQWTCRQSACRNLIDRLPAVIRLLEDITNESSGDRAVDAQCLLSQIDVTFIGLLVIFNKILTHSKFLSDMIQSPGVDLAKAVELVDVLLETLQNYRDEDAFEKIWTEVKTTCQKCEISVTMAKKEATES